MIKKSLKIVMCHANNCFKACKWFLFFKLWQLFYFYDENCTWVQPSLNAYKLILVYYDKYIILYNFTLHINSTLRILSILSFKNCIVFKCLKRKWNRKNFWTKFTFKCKNYYWKINNITLLFCYLLGVSVSQFNPADPNYAVMSGYLNLF